MNPDQATSVRPGESLNESRLRAYLQEQLGDPSSTLTVRQFPSGYSNLTYLITTAQREYVLRRPPMGTYAPRAHDMQREHQVLSLLKPVYDQVPTPLHYCEDEAVIGAPFYLMERVPGVILRGPTSKDAELPPALMQHLSEKAVDQLVDLHALDIEQTGLVQLGKPEGYVPRQVEGWTTRYRRAETNEIAGMNEAMDWLAGNIPAEQAAPAFIHNDYKYDNLVLAPHDTRIIAVLDWEMATVGDPLMDLGTTLGYWAEEQDHPALKPFNLTWLPGNLSREAVAQRYADRSSCDLSHLLFYYVFGCFKIGVIVQQIYARYRQGHTQDPRFAGLIHVVQACADNVQKAISLNRISHLY